MIGAGVSGLSCAWRLSRTPGLDVTLYEAEGRAGGHANTVDVTLDGVTHPVDTGFLVFNHRTYPRLVELFATLDVPTVKSEMTFSVQAERPGHAALEWAGTDLGTVFVQRRNLASPRFLRMLADILRFNRAATALADEPDQASVSLGAWLDAHRYSAAFRDWYLLPMAAAIWSCSTAQMRDFPVATFVRFCANHGLLQIADRPPWYTVVGGSRTYVDRMLATLADVRLDRPVVSVSRSNGRLAVRAVDGVESYDHVVLACHSDQALAMLEADAAHADVLRAIRYQPNDAVLHTDASVLPRDPRAWAAWNYRSDGNEDARRVAVHYLIDQLQPLPFTTPVIVSLNPSSAIDPAKVIRRFDYAHPLFDAAAIAAQGRVPDVQGRDGVWLCGAWTGYGFHEDGLRSGLAVADAIRARFDAEARLAA